MEAGYHSKKSGLTVKVASEHSPEGGEEEPCRDLGEGATASAKVLRWESAWLIRGATERQWVQQEKEGEVDEREVTRDRPCRAL